MIFGESCNNKAGTRTPVVSMGNKITDPDNTSVVCCQCLYLKELLNFS